MTSTLDSVSLVKHARQYLHYLSVELPTRRVGGGGDMRVFHRDLKKVCPHTPRDIPALVDPERLVEAAFTIRVFVNTLSPYQVSS